MLKKWLVLVNIQKVSMEKISTNQKVSTFNKKFHVPPIFLNNKYKVQKKPKKFLDMEILEKFSTYGIIFS